MCIIVVAMVTLYVKFLFFLLCGNSHPMKAASNNHSPKRCKIVLHFARPGAKGLLGSEPKDVKAKILQIYFFLKIN